MVILPTHPDCADDVPSMVPDAHEHSKPDESDDILSVESVNSGRRSAVSNSSKIINTLLPDSLKEVDPVKFPLYSIHSGKSDSVHKPCGHLPLVCLWAKKLRPRRFHKTTGTVNMQLEYR